MKSEYQQLQRRLAQARAKVKGKTFQECPELFKDIEGIKVLIARCLNPNHYKVTNHG